ncbi:hypothetical protein HZA75_07150 [Candidatus Roizmanbacteria bacterium]|nr:hypothetical protein [Candidatus Roizmanbacteria bacterium]
MKLNKYNTFLIGYLLQNIVFWIGIQSSKITDLPINLLYSFSNGFMATIAGVFGIVISTHWGGMKSAVGKAILYISLGTTSWGLGTLVWSFYNFVLHVAVPYPSLADVGYVGAIPLWMLGMFYLAKATGVKYGLRKKIGQLFLVILPIICFAISYYLQVTVARGGAITSGYNLLKVFFDFAYPIGDVIILTIAFLMYGLTFRYLGGRYKWPVFIILFGFIFMFFSDFIFTYSTTVKTYFNGHLADLFYTVSLVIISLGVCSFDIKGS